MVTVIGLVVRVLVGDGQGHGATGVDVCGDFDGIAAKEDQIQSFKFIVC